MTDTVIAPGPSSVGIINNGLRFFQDPLESLSHMHHKYGDFVRFRLSPHLSAYLLSHPDHISQVLSKNQHKYVKCSPHGLLQREIGSGLLFNSDMENWHKQRRLIQPAFYACNFARFSEDAVELTAAFVVQRRRELLTGTVLDVQKEMLSLSQLIIGKAVLGIDIREEINNILKHSGGKFGLLMGTSPFLPRNRLFRKAVDHLNMTINRAIEDHIRRPNQQTILSSLLVAPDNENLQPMQREQLRQEILTLIFAGYDTTAKSLSWAWYLLSQNAGPEEKMIGEVNRVLGVKLPSLEDLGALVYTKAVVKETLRIFPPNVVLGRRAIADDQIGDYRVRAGSIVVICPFLLHHHPRFWDAPNSFCPERFLPDVGKKPYPSSYIPFGSGARHCIGRGMANHTIPLIIATIAQHCRFRAIPNFQINPHIDITLKSRNGVKLSIEWLE